jgi:hypothetical protein
MDAIFALPIVDGSIGFASSTSVSQFGRKLSRGIPRITPLI